MIYQILAGFGCLVMFWYLPLSIEKRELDTPTPKYSFSIPHSVCKQREVITVFIHGSLHVPLAFLSPLRVAFDSFNGNSWYENTSVRLRDHPSTKQCGVVLDPGLMEITHLVNQRELPTACKYNGAYHVIHCFHQCTTAASSVQHRYFTFGWSGILSERERESAAEVLYDALLELKNTAAYSGRPIEFELYAFSHGGQLALHLPHVRKKRGDTHFSIDRVILSAVPLYPKNSKNLLENMFGTVINCYSPGDFAQTIDHFSTPYGRCFQTIAETLSLPQNHTTRLIDLAITLDNKYPIPHRAFFDIDQLAIAPTRVRRSERYRTRHLPAYQVTSMLSPLPLVVLYPMLLTPLTTLNSIDTPKNYRRINLNLRSNGDKFHAVYTPHQEPPKYEITWRPGDTIEQCRLFLEQSLIEQPKPGVLQTLFHEISCAARALFS